MAKRAQKRKRRSFTPEFKAEAVRLCRVGDRTIGQVARDLDLTETALREWVSRAEVGSGGDDAQLTSDERDELKELRKRVKRLEMEREILKNFRARFALPVGQKLLIAYRDVPVRSGRKLFGAKSP